MATSVCTPSGSHRCSMVMGNVTARPMMKGIMRPLQRAPPRAALDFLAAEPVDDVGMERAPLILGAHAPPAALDQPSQCRRRVGRRVARRVEPGPLHTVPPSRQAVVVGYLDDQARARRCHGPQLAQRGTGIVEVLERMPHGDDIEGREGCHHVELTFMQGQSLPQRARHRPPVGIEIHPTRPRAALPVHPGQEGRSAASHVEQRRRPGERTRCGARCEAGRGRAATGRSRPGTPSGPTRPTRDAAGSSRSTRRSAPAARAGLRYTCSQRPHVTQANDSLLVLESSGPASRSSGRGSSAPQLTHAAMFEERHGAARRCARATGPPVRLASCRRGVLRGGQPAERGAHRNRHRLAHATELL